ncbi:uncharacterized protein LOC112528615 [Cynara cardunculus var. scolymus]|uniref:uncharacterized protein LOC112528615 n=1 Tax=Cynara cardunculus var. scolymus TaxID=59895 RepID=UPI000D6235CB|nr:uncharacterized protein LOC112528615 [Cynara cardunculus var. scolymus]
MLLPRAWLHLQPQALPSFIDSRPLLPASLPAHRFRPVGHCSLFPLPPSCCFQLPACLNLDSCSAPDRALPPTAADCVYCYSKLVDESSDVSKKEQMAVVLRYVDARGIVKERFFGKMASCCGGLRNVVNALSKLKDMLLQSYKDRVQEAIGKCEIETGTKKYQELSLIRAGDTRWGSHYKTILRLIALFPNVVEVLKCVEEDVDNGFNRTQATDLLKLSELYPHDFSRMEKIALEKQLKMYYLIVRQDERFADLSGIAELARLLVETKKHTTYPLVYRLLKLALVLPVDVATVERCFSAMKIVKSDLRKQNR